MGWVKRHLNHASVAASAGVVPRARGRARATDERIARNRVRPTSPAPIATHHLVVTVVDDSDAPVKLER